MMGVSSRNNARPGPRLTTAIPTMPVYRQGHSSKHLGFVGPSVPS